MFTDLEIETLIQLLKRELDETKLDDETHSDNTAATLYIDHLERLLTKLEALKRLLECGG
jgi:hypothetical protein